MYSLALTFVSVLAIVKWINVSWKVLLGIQFKFPVHALSIVKIVCYSRNYSYPIYASSLKFTLSNGNVLKLLLLNMKLKPQGLGM